MEILTTQVLNGPNYWSNFRKKLVVLTLDIQDYEEKPSNLLPGFPSRLKKLIPSLKSHYCSEGVEGGFFMRLDDGTWMGHIVEHIALELQNLAGMDCGFGRTYGTHQKGIYHVLITYEFEEAGCYAAKAAVNIVRCLAENKPYQQLSKDIFELKKIADSEKLGPSTAAIVAEAKQRQIPFHLFPGTSLVLLGQGVNQKKIWANTTSTTSSIGVEIAADKNLTKEILYDNFIPTPRGVVIGSLLELEEAVKRIGFPLVIKPKDGNHGRGITTNITSLDRAFFGFEVAKKSSSEVIVERHIAGEDYRFLVVNYKVIAVAKRIPAHVVGDGEHSIQALINHINQNPLRGPSHDNYLTEITVDTITKAILAQKKLTLEDVLSKGEVLFLKDSANLSTGGTAVDVTCEVHPNTLLMAERIARLLQLDICGIDAVIQDIRQPIDEGTGAIIEVNASPGLRMHLSPSEGKKRNVAAPILDMLYPNKTPASIPVVAVTGTNGKTSVVRLIARMAKNAGHCVGFTTTEGIYLNEQCVFIGDCSGPQSAKAVLQDSQVDFAVLECARGGILRAGLPFDTCNISVITNISNDHLGLDDIHSLEDLAEVKAVVARATSKNGLAVLNADDDLVCAIGEKLNCSVAFFSLDNRNTTLLAHAKKGGLAAYIDNQTVMLCQDYETFPIGKISDFPVTLDGRALCMIKNLLPAILAAVGSGFSLSVIRNTLLDFYPSAEDNPGRMNYYDFEHFDLIIDYAHNEGAFIDLKHYVNHQSSSKKIGIIAALGDRPLIDANQLGFHAAEIFDEIIIRHNSDKRGCSNESLSEAILEGH